MENQCFLRRLSGAKRLAVALVAVSMAGCAQPSTPINTQVTGSLTVLAAASLTDVFTTIGTAFQNANPGAQVKFSFDGSSTLVNQIEQGAPADVFASADQANMSTLADAGFVDGQPVLFTANTLTIAVPADNPAHITALADLANPGVRIVVCAPEVPCGAVAQKVFTAAGVSISPVSQEQNVKAVVTKLTLGEADAGLVYTTDVAAAGGALTAVALPTDSAVQAAAVTQYPITVVKGSPNAALARQFIAFVTSSQGQQILHDAGFQPIA